MAIPGMNHQQLSDLLTRADSVLGEILVAEQQFQSLPGQYGAIAKAALAATSLLKLLIGEVRQIIGHTRLVTNVGVTSPLPTTPNAPAVLPGRTDQPTFTPGG
jgi:hypothetical protein